MGAEVGFHPTFNRNYDRDHRLSKCSSHRRVSINATYLMVSMFGISGGSGCSIVCGPDGRYYIKAED